MGHFSIFQHIILVFWPATLGLLFLEHLGAEGEDREQNTAEKRVNYIHQVDTNTTINEC